MPDYIIAFDHRDMMVSANKWQPPQCRVAATLLPSMPPGHICGRTWWGKGINSALSISNPIQIQYTLIHMDTLHTTYKLHATYSLNLHVFKTYGYFLSLKLKAQSSYSGWWTPIHFGFPLTDWLKLDPLVGTTHFKGRITTVDVIA